MIAPPAKTSGYVASITDTMAPPAEKARHKHLAAVDGEFHDGAVDHPTDRERFAAIARGIAWQEPGEAVLRIVRRLLFGIDDNEPKAIGECGPACPVVVAFGGLCAAMQGHDESRSPRQAVRNVGEHAQVARGCAKISDLPQAT